jgi:hypothetical protein
LKLQAKIKEVFTSFRFSDFKIGTEWKKSDSCRRDARIKIEGMMSLDVV